MHSPVLLILFALVVPLVLYRNIRSHQDLLAQGFIEEQKRLQARLETLERRLVNLDGVPSHLTTLQVTIETSRQNWERKMSSVTTELDIIKRLPEYRSRQASRDAIHNLRRS